MFLLTRIVVAESARMQAQKVVAFIVLSLVCSAGIACAIATPRSGYRIDDVRNLRSIAGAAQGNRQQVCEITGARSKRWRQTLRILAPDVLGCSATDLLRVTPDASGLPIPHALKRGDGERGVPTEEKLTAYGSTIGSQRREETQK